MVRKKWQARTEITPTLLKFREKKKWQIALRRYVVERNASVFYAPYFGLDIEKMRDWFECQFEKRVGWDDFGTSWQLEHVIPINYFDFSQEKELKLCWNFLNLRVDILVDKLPGAARTDLLGCKAYFKALFGATGLPTCQAMLEKIADLESLEKISTAAQEDFLTAQQDYLKQIHEFSTTEFELLNRGRTVSEARKEAEFLKKYTG